MAAAERAERVAAMSVLSWEDGRSRRVRDELVVEEPLEIRVKGRPVSVTMRTPGDDEELAIGFLLTEGLIVSRDDVQSMDRGEEPEDVAEERSSHRDSHRDSDPDSQPDSTPGSHPQANPRVDARSRRRNLIDVALRPGIAVDFERLSRHVFAASSCGICGKASIDAIRVGGLRPPDRDVRLDPDVLCGMPDTLRASQAVFGTTGGLHAAGLFDLTGRLLAIREDVGRHNAVDKVIGHALLTGAPAGGPALDRSVLVVSGRGGFEIVQKALVARIPIVAAVSAPSSLAVELARELGQTLIGFLRGTRFVVYAGGERVGLDVGPGGDAGAP